jgi:autotransporter translocation and assembly factor TamB
MTFNTRAFLRFSAKTLLAVLSLCFVLLITAAIILQSAIFWLNSDNGGKWLATHIETALEDKPYHLELDNFSLAGLFGIQAGDVLVSDKDGVFLTASDLSLRINPISLLVQSLSITLHGERFALQRLPSLETPQNTDENTHTDLTLPDLFIKNVDLGVEIEDLTLNETILSGGLQTSLTWRQNFRLDSSELSGKGVLALENTQTPLKDYMPKTLRNEFNLDPKTQLLQISALNLKHPDYYLKTKGSYTLHASEIDMHVIGAWENVKKFTSDLNKPITADLKLSGTTSQLSGKLSVNTLYKNMEISPILMLEKQGQTIAIQDIKGNAGPATLDGNINYNLDTENANGQVIARIQNLSDLKDSIPIDDISGSGILTANISSPNGSPAISLNADLNNTVIASTELEKASLQVTQADTGYMGDISIKGYQINPFDIKGKIHLVSPSPLHIDVKDLTATLAGGKANISGKISQEELDAKLTAQNLNLMTLPFANLSNVPLILAQADGTFRGDLSQPKIDLSYTLNPANENTYHAAIEGQTIYNGEAFNTNITLNGEGIKESAISVQIPAKLSFYPFHTDISGKSSIQGQAQIDADLRPVTSLFMPPTYEIGGDMNMNASLKGTLASPDLAGQTHVRDGYIHAAANAFELNDIAAEARFENHKVHITSLQASGVDGQGTLNATADLDLSNMQKPDIDADLVIDAMHLIGQNYNTRLDADMQFSSGLGGYSLAGTITPEEVNINLPERFQKSIPELNIVTEKEELSAANKAKSMISLDILLDAPQHIFVRGWGLDAELGGKLDISGNLHEPLINGRLSSIRGRYEEFGRDFNLNKANLRFQGTVPPSPYFDIEAAAEIEDITAKVLITKNMKDPKISFAALPPLPEDEVLSLILFGTSIENISPFQAVQLASTLRRFSGQGSLMPNPLETLENITGLDDIRVKNTGEDVSVGAGKYISDKIYVEVEKGSAEASGAASVEVEVTPSVKVESKAGQNGDNSIGAFWEWSY